MVSVPGDPNLWTTVALLDESARDAVERLRRRGAVWWRGRPGGAPPAADGWTRADAVAHLVAGYAAAGQAVEVGASPAPETYRGPVRPTRDAVLADQLAVVSYDLVLALRAARPGAPARYPDRLTTVERVGITMLAETLVRLHDVDPRPLDDAAAGAVVATLYPTAAAELAGQFGSLGDLLLRLERGPGEWRREV